MRMYLSSYQMGEAAAELRRLLRGGRRGVVIANALDPYADGEGRKTRIERQIAVLAEVGCAARELDLRDYFGQASRLRERLADVDLIWAHGGNSFVLERAFEQSGCDLILVERLAADTLVYGGFSAALMMVAPTMRGIELCDDIVTIPGGYRPEFSWDSLGLVPYSIAPHYRSDHPESAMIEDVVAYFERERLPYRALRDGEVIVVDEQGDRLVGRPNTVWPGPTPR